MKVILCIFIIIEVLGLILFFIEIKNAPLIDDKKPFLKDDYDPYKGQNTLMSIKT